MALERVPADIRSQGGVARMSDPKMIKEIMDAVTIPVMAKARIGHFVECQVSTGPSMPPSMPPSTPPQSCVCCEHRARPLTQLQILEAIGVDYIDESEVLTPADETYHVDKHPFKVPFVCGCRNLGEALRRISEGAAMSKST